MPKRKQRKQRDIFYSLTKALCENEMKMAASRMENYFKTLQWFLENGNKPFSSTQKNWLTKAKGFHV